MPRPRTALVLLRKSRRCPKCGKALNNQLKRCKACAAVVDIPRPTKSKKKKKFRLKRKPPIG